jgi:hypothetical protein
MSAFLGRRVSPPYEISPPIAAIGGKRFGGGPAALETLMMRKWWLCVEEMDEELEGAPFRRSLAVVGGFIHYG